MTAAEPAPGHLDEPASNPGSAAGIGSAPAGAGGAPDRPPPKGVANLLRTIERLAEDADSAVSFGRLVQVRRIAAREPELEDRAVATEDVLLDRFEATTGRIIKRYDCTHTMGGCALIETPDHAVSLEIVLNSLDPRLIALEVGCLEVRDQIAELPRVGSTPRAGRDTLNALYSVLTAVLAVADRLARQERRRHEAERDNGWVPAALAAAEDGLDAARRRAGVVHQRWARGVYLSGALLGVAMTLVLIAAVGVACAAYWHAVIATAPLVLATVFGALGAVVSVVQRMSTGRLVLDPTATKGQLRAFALLRPMLGAISAAVGQFIMGSGVIAAQGGAVTATTLGPYAVIGFAAGFSERFAVDMMERAGRVLTGTPVDPGATPRTPPASPISPQNARPDESASD